MSQRATQGRIVLVYSTLWEGAVPGIVVGGPFNEPAEGSRHPQLANVNVFVDGVNHRAALDAFRNRPEGNTFTSIPVYRSPLPEDGVQPSTWATFPPRVGEAVAPKPLEFNCPYKPGDFVVVKVGDVVGQIEDISWRITGLTAICVVTASINGEFQSRWFDLCQVAPCPESRIPRDWQRA